MTQHIVSLHMCDTRLRTILLAGQESVGIDGDPECMRIHSQLTLGAGPIDRCHVMTRVNEKCIDLHQLLPSMLLTEASGYPAVTPQLRIDLNGRSGLTDRVYELTCKEDSWHTAVRMLDLYREHGNALQFPNTLPHYFTFGKSSISSPKAIPATHSRCSGHAKQANDAID